jgi:hypothetical protein
VIGYQVSGALNHFTDHEELYWNAIGNEWLVPIARGTSTVSGPAEITRIGCFAGPRTSQLPCESATASGHSAA